MALLDNWLAPPASTAPAHTLPTAQRAKAYDGGGRDSSPTARRLSTMLREYRRATALDAALEAAVGEVAAEYRALGAAPQIAVITRKALLEHAGVPKAAGGEPRGRYEAIVTRGVQAYFTVCGA